MNQIEIALKDNKFSGKSKVDVLSPNALDNLSNEFGIKNSQWRDLYIVLNGDQSEKTIINMKSIEISL